MPFTIATPNLLTDPGAMFSAPVGSALPANTVSGSVFTDSWVSPWVPMGATEDGYDFTYDIKTEMITVAEFFDPIKWATTERSGNFAFTVVDWTLTRVSQVMNGGTLAIVSGTGATQLNQFTPPAAGAETRRMLGWESLDHTVRIIAYQCINSGSIKSSFKKAPAKAGLACQFNFEIPSSGKPFDIFSAGTTRQ
jgi:hypothetical protein